MNKFDLSEIETDESHWYHTKMVRELWIIGFVVGIACLLVIF